VGLDERVLCIPATHLESLGRFEGFRPANEAERQALLDPRQFQFHPRSAVETDPTYLQLIPYVVLKSGRQVFHYQRGTSGTEARLRALWSIGIGGHISEADAAASADPYRTGMFRELNEEVDLRSDYRVRGLGFIYDPRTLVGQVHLGVVHLLELETPQVSARESALANAGFVPLDQLQQTRELYETWSQFILTLLAQEL
jgi:predicted NUDIX family phosphoesterase